MEAGRGPEPNEPPFKFYDYHELGKLFRRGENVVAVLAYNLGIGTHFYGAGPGGFLLATLGASDVPGSATWA